MFLPMVIERGWSSREVQPDRGVLEPTVYLTSPELFTLPQALTRYTDAYGGEMWNTQLAAATMTVVPVLVVFVIAQRQFVEGLAHSGLKGRG